MKAARSQGTAETDAAVRVEYFSQRDPAVPNDQWVIECVLPAKRQGYFVEAGARDGITDSNTYALERYFGWEGICVEPHRADYERLIENRACSCANVCLFSAAGSVRYIEHSGLGGIAKHIRHPNQVKDSPIVDVEALTLEQLLGRYAAPTIVDYLSLDTEGTEYLILRDFPFERYAFRCISVEGYECNELLGGRGYERVSNPFITDFHWEQYFVRRDLL